MWGCIAIAVVALAIAVISAKAGIHARATQLMAIVAFGFALAALHANHAMSIRLPASLEGQDTRIRGRVVDLPDREARRVQFLIRVDDDASQTDALRGRLLRIAWYDGGQSRSPSVYAGSRWEFDARLRAPRGLRNPGWFDAERHALANRLAATGYVRNAASAREIAHPAGLQAWRADVASRIDAAIDAPVARFIRALALGDTRGLDDDDWATLRATGLTHLIAISGFHVGLVAGFFALLASLPWRLLPSLALRVPRPIAMAVAAVIGALLYTAVAGFALPTVRTTLMIAVVAAVRCARRAQSSFAALSLAVVAMVLVDPLSLLGAGFWLSVCGVAWLLWCLPNADGGVLRAFASAQAVATIGLLPLTVALFGQASLAGPVSNLVAIPWWSLVVVPLALIGTALDALHAGLGVRPWRIAGHAFDATWPAFVVIGDSPFAFAWLPEARWYALPFAAFAALWVLLPRGVPGKPLAMLLWLPLLWPARDLPPHGAFRIDVLDVGQGLSALVRTASHAVLFDMGPASHDGYDAGERAVVPALRALGVRALDVAIVSHADSDHAGGWNAVRNAMTIDDSHAPEGSPSPVASRCIAGRTWQRDGVRFRYLHPTEHFPYLGNDAGCVLRIDGAHGAALLTGDIGEVVERALVRRDPAALRADVVLVPHHGSEGSSDPAFIAATQARVALVATGAGNRFGHPRAEVVARWCRAGARVFDTAGGGALRVDVGLNGVNTAARRETHARLWDAARRSGRMAGLCYRRNDGPGPEE
ncbi:DNA internalization-related competence protein ComEC/Rec2 [Noviluteimonas dokdonensis]|nr:DNA internalization-related competence protein ComEC/Rec2 [Lysobacter dokdonensis]